MKFYLSSYKLGKKARRIRGLMPSSNKRIGFIPNALDFVGADPKRRERGIQREMDELKQLGLDVELLDLKDYFNKASKLKRKIAELGGVFVKGGNTFVLRQAMRLSGFDRIIKEMKRDFLYAGYSAGVCVLADDLKALRIMDDPKNKPYKEFKKTIWKGLGLIDYFIVPHYRSNHRESANSEKEVQYCIDNKIQFRALKDGEVIIITR